jgi:error-prone DNA polymerase
VNSSNSAYAELHCLSNFSFLRGASHPGELVQAAAELGYAGLALTDECSVAGVVRAHTAAKDLPLKLIVGSELVCEDGLKVVVLAEDRSAYAALCGLISRARRAAPKGAYRIGRDDVAECLQAHGLLLWLPSGATHDDDVATGRWLEERFGGRLWLAVELLNAGNDRRRLELARTLGLKLDLPLVAAGNVHMHCRERRMLQNTLTAIRHKVPLDELGFELHSNAERSLRPKLELERRYPAELLLESLAICERVDFSLTELRYEYPSELIPKGETPTSYLRALTERGRRWRWPVGESPKVRRLIEHELALIAELRYEAYFLTVHDIVNYARSIGILCQGRGSAANSVVCFCLGITEVDPDRMQTLVERFISKERNEPPDIDVDFEHERREEVIQYIYGKYSRERAALAATVITYRGRSAIRDVGKALGVDELHVSALARTLQWWESGVIDDAGMDARGRATQGAVAEQRIRECGLDPKSPKVWRWIKLAESLLGFPRHLSQHVGGFVIAERPITELVPIENAAMPERTVIQWDKDDLEELGLMKVDVLGLGMLSAVRRSFALIEQFSGERHTLATVPAEDKGVYEMICRADTMGVFQIESRAQMAMLPRLKPKSYFDLVIEVAIVRPGPIQGDMVHPYLRRREGKEEVTYPSLAVKEVLERTLGVPIFQEQVMQLAIVAAGFTPGEADQLRRAMAAWRRNGELEKFEQRLIGGMIARNYPEEFAQRLFSQIKGFGEYGFPECVVGETRVVDADTGRWLTIDEVVSGSAGLKNTLACDEALRLRKRRVLAVTPSGVKPVWRLRTKLGHSIVATAEHPFMTMRGWVELGKLRIGDYVAVARSVPLSGRLRWPRHQILVLADLLAEGNLCHPSTFYFYTTAAWHRDEFVRAVERFPNTRAVVERHRNCFSVRVVRRKRELPTGAVEWAKSLGIWGQGAREKHVPPEVFELCDKDIALLLARLWEGDGSFSTTAGQASYDTASHRLGLEVQHLLLRLGIVSRRYRRTRTYKGRQLEHYVVTITGVDQLRRFWHCIGRRFLDPKKRRQSKTLTTRRDGRMSRDVVPAEVRTLIRRERDTAGLTWCEIGRLSVLSVREIQSRGSSKGGFRRFVIEASVLRSPDLVRLSNSDIYWDRIVAIEALGPQPTYDLQIEGDHNFLANNLVVHNSHAASFALLVYVSAWLKCYEPAAFCAALLNSQPMGFYAPQQLVRSARDHGVEVRPVDVNHSDWDCTLERGTDGSPVVRLGMRLVKGLAQDSATRLLEARTTARFTGVQDLAERARLNAKDLGALASAGALGTLASHRHLARWDVAGVEEPTELLERVRFAEAVPILRRPIEGEDIAADYRYLGVSLGRHPLTLLRARLAAAGISTAREVAELAPGARVRSAGLVITRQRPASASGVTFVTLEDETGYLNLVVWERLAEQARRALVGAKLLGVEGFVQKESGVLHVIAERLVDHSELLGKLVTRPRDFH